MKRFLMPLITLFLLIAALPLPTALATATGTSATGAQKDHNIDYTQAIASDRYILRCTENSDIYIDMAAERLYVPASVGAVALSIDGGQKWKAYSFPESGLDINKLLNKGGIFQITDSLDAKGKAPNKEDVKDEEGNVTAAKSKVYQFPAIAPRPKLSSFTINYSVYADATGATPGQWTLTEKNSDTPLSVSMQIAPSSSKKTPDNVKVDEQGKLSDAGTKTVQWGLLPKGTGINVQPMSSGSKVAKPTYLIRTEPTTTIPASKAKKISASGLGKASKFKADYKKDLIKLKENASVFVGGATELAANKDASNVTIYNKEQAKEGRLLTVRDTKNRVIKDDYGKTLAIWTAATQKKPATTPQYYTPAARAFMDESVQPTFTASTVKIDTKKYEVLNPDKGTYATSVPKTTASKKYSIRMKATAKAGKETSSTYAPSLDGTLVVTWGVLDPSKDKEKSGIIDAFIEAPEYPGILRGRPTIPDKTNQSTLEAVEMSGYSYINYDITGFLNADDSSKLIVGSGAENETADAGVIKVVPVVTYDNKTDPADSVGLKLTLDTATNKAVLEISPRLPSTGKIGLKFIFGSDLVPPVVTDEDGDTTTDMSEVGTKYYDEERSGSRPIKFKITPAEGSPEIQDVVTDAESAVRASVTKTAIGSTRIDRAVTGAGEISISRNGSLILTGARNKNTSGVFTSVLEGAASGAALSYAVFGGTSAELAALDMNTDDIKNKFKLFGSTVEATHTYWLVIRFFEGTNTDGSDKRTLLFVFKMTDNVGPAVKSSSYDGTGTVTLVYDEPLSIANGTNVSGFSIDPLTGSNVQSASAVIDASDGTNSTVKVTVGSWSSGTCTLRYDSSSGTIKDQYSNKAYSTQISIGTGTSLLESITFDNGYAGTPITFANPKSFAATDTNYYDKIIYVPLRSTAACNVTVNVKDGKDAKFSLFSSKATNLNLINSFTNGKASILGMTTDWYMYVTVGSEYYCFYISRTAAQTADNVAPAVSSAVASVSGNTMTIAVSFNKVVAPIGYGIMKNELKLSNTGMVVDYTYFDDGKQYVVVKDADAGTPVVSRLNSASSVDLIYSRTSADYIMGPGTAVLGGFTYKINVTALPAPSPTPSSSPS